MNEQGYENKMMSTPYSIKERLLKGSKMRKVVEVPDAEGGVIEVTIRPLYDAEATEIQGMVLAGMDLQFDMEQLNVTADSGKQLIQGLMQKMGSDAIAGIFRNNAAANAKICAWCIVDNQGQSLFTLDEVKQFTGGLTGRIAEEVRALSGTEEDKRVNNFR